MVISGVCVARKQKSGQEVSYYRIFLFLLTKKTVWVQTKTCSWVKYLIASRKFWFLGSFFSCTTKASHTKTSNKNVSFHKSLHIHVHLVNFLFFLWLLKNIKQSFFQSNYRLCHKNPFLEETWAPSNLVW